MDQRHKAFFLSINYLGWIEVLGDKINSVIRDDIFNLSKSVLQEHKGHDEQFSGPVKEEFLPYKSSLSMANFFMFLTGVRTG